MLEDELDQEKHDAFGTRGSSEGKKEAAEVTRKKAKEIFLPVFFFGSWKRRKATRKNNWNRVLGFGETERQAVGAARDKFYDTKRCFDDALGEAGQKQQQNRRQRTKKMSGRNL